MEPIDPQHPLLLRIADRLRLLGQPIRLLICGILKHGEFSVSEIAGKLELPVATVSHHLKVMERGGLLSSRREGRHIYYSVSAPLVGQVCDALCGQIDADIKTTKEERASLARLRERLKP